MKAAAAPAAVPLELLHPAGKVSRVLVLGDRCPAWLLPPVAAAAHSEIDLALIAPSRAQLRQRGWLARVAAEAAGALREDGFVYALVPRGGRRAARRRLTAAGLVVDSTLAQLPAGESPRYLVPLGGPAFRDALERRIGARPGARRALVALRGLPYGESLLGTALPAVGMVARPPGAGPPAAWVSGLGGQTRPVGHVIVGMGWRWPQSPVVVYCFAAGEVEPWGIVKLGPGSQREAKLLERLGASAAAAGARLPRLLAAGEVAGRPALAETVLEGRPAAELLERSPDRFDEVMSAVAGWLDRWQQATAQRTSASVDLLERALLAPLAELEDELPEAPAYRDWLAVRCAAIAGEEVPLVATHNDLTMWNVLLAPPGEIGVLDWAEAREAALPLTDFFYAVVDAASACDGYRSRLEALRDSFEPGGARADAVDALRERLRASLDLRAETVELSFHACWLHHAANERRAGGGAGGPFLQIVSWLARRAREQA